MDVANCLREGGNDGLYDFLGNDATSFFFFVYAFKWFGAVGCFVVYFEVSVGVGRGSHFLYGDRDLGVLRSFPNVFVTLFTGDRTYCRDYRDEYGDPVRDYCAAAAKCEVASNCFVRGVHCFRVCWRGSLVF